MSTGVSLALGVALSVTMIVGIYPEPFINMAREAVRPLFS
jgi:hypothetical protein